MTYNWVFRYDIQLGVQVWQHTIGCSSMSYDIQLGDQVWHTTGCSGMTYNWVFKYDIQLGAQLMLNFSFKFQATSTSNCQQEIKTHALRRIRHRVTPKHPMREELLEFATTSSVNISWGGGGSRLLSPFPTYVRDEMSSGKRHHSWGRWQVGFLSRLWLSWALFRPSVIPVMCQICVIYWHIISNQQPHSDISGSTRLSNVKWAER